MGRTAILIPALALGLAACAGTGDDLPTLMDTDWAVVGIGALALDPADGVSILFEDGRVMGNAGCNLYSAPVTIGAARLQVGTVASTRMACPGRANEVEQRFFDALDRVDGWTVAADGVLTLTSAGAPAIRAVAP